MEKLLELNEVKKIELEILKFVANFCDANGLRYFLDAGTLLGAIRHQGFIPWDDDIDIILPRTDYDRLVEIFPRQNAEKFILLSSCNNKHYFYPWIKIIDSTTRIVEKDVPAIDNYGIYIDVFPLDGLPEDEKQRRFLQEKLWRYRMMRVYSLSTKKIGIKKKILGSLFGIIGFRYFLEQEQKIASSNNYDNSIYCNGMLASSKKYRFYSKQIFEQKVEVMFENEKFWAPGGYDEYLRGMYGDYMVLPPKEQQRMTHEFKAYKI